jgi:hypothetical protein
VYFGLVDVAVAVTATVWGAPGHCLREGEAHWRLLRYQQNISALFRQAQSWRVVSEFVSENGICEKGKMMTTW